MNLLLHGLLSGWWNSGYRHRQVPSLCCFSVWCFKRCLTLTIKLQIFITLVKSKLNSEVKSLHTAVAFYVAIFHITFLTNPWRFHDNIIYHYEMDTNILLHCQNPVYPYWIIFFRKWWKVQCKQKAKKSLWDRKDLTQKNLQPVPLKMNFFMKILFFSERKLNVVNFHLQTTKFILNAKGREPKVNLASQKQLNRMNIMWAYNTQEIWMPSYKRCDLVNSFLRLS